MTISRAASDALSACRTFGIGTVRTRPRDSRNSGIRGTRAPRTRGASDPLGDPPRGRETSRDDRARPGAGPRPQASAVDTLPKPRRPTAQEPCAVIGQKKSEPARAVTRSLPADDCKSCNVGDAKPLKKGERPKTPSWPAHTIPPSAPSETSPYATLGIARSLPASPSRPPLRPRGLRPDRGR